jgi:hypothetical protein
VKNNHGVNPTATEAVRDDLVERIVKTTRSAQSVPFYRRVIRQLGDGIVEEEFGELRYRMLTGEVRDPARYFTKLLVKRVCSLGKLVDAQRDGVKEAKNGSKDLFGSRTSCTSQKQPRQLASYAAASGGDLLSELRPLSSPAATVPSPPAVMEPPYSRKAVPWATFVGPEFFTLSTNPAKSDRVIAQFRSLHGNVVAVPMIRGRLFPQDEERGILTAEHGRILGAIECLWVEQGCQYARFGNGAVSCFCRVPIRRLSQLLGWEAFGGRDLAHLKRKTIKLKVTGYYMELEAVEEFRRAGVKGFGFSLIDGFDLVDRTRHGLEQTTFRVLFSDPYSRQLLARRVVTRPKEMLKMRSELAFLLRLYLEPILIGRGVGREHSIELLNLIRVLNLPPAGWHQFKSRRKAIFAKAIQEFRSMKTVDGGEMDLGIQQGLNQRDFMLVARLVSKAHPLSPISLGGQRGRQEMRSRLAGTTLILDQNKMADHESTRMTSLYDRRGDADHT